MPLDYVSSGIITFLRLASPTLTIHNTMAVKCHSQSSAFHNHTGSQFVGTGNYGGNVYIGGNIPITWLRNCFCSEPWLMVVLPAANQGWEKEEAELLTKLPYAKSATINHYPWQGESQCLAGTCLQVLTNIMAWARSSTGGSQHRIFWLNGMASTCKSTIPRTVACICSEEERFGASFFFLRGGGKLETARTFVTTIAVQLARRHSQLRASICNALRADWELPKLMLSDQWRQLVLGPRERVRAAGALPTPLVIVINAHDECTVPAEIEFMLALLTGKSPGLAVAAVVAPLRIFLTSRQEITVRAGLHNLSDARRRHIILHHVQMSVVNHDIGPFFKHYLASIILRLPLLPNFPDEEVLQQLVQRADGLFIWAAMACHFIKDSGPHMRNRLHLIVMQRLSVVATSPEGKLDGIYTSVLRNTLREHWTTDEQEQFCRSLNEVLGTIAVLFSSLSASELAARLSSSETEVNDVLCDLHSVLDVLLDPSTPIRPQHASVRVFLLSNHRCTDTRFWVDEYQAHACVARQCLQLMTKMFKKDICSLAEPGALVKDVDRGWIDACLLPSLRYACRHWVQHVEQS